MQKNGVTRKRKGIVLVEIILVMIIIGCMAPPVFGYQFSNGIQNTLPPLNISKIISGEPSHTDLSKSNLTPIELKLGSDLRDLLAIQKTSKDLKNEKPAQYLENVGLYKSGNVSLINGISVQTSPDIVLIRITISPGNSTHILDPYIYQLNSRRESSRALSAWVDVSKIGEIANISTVTSIRTVTPASYGMGSYPTQGNGTLHVKEILELPEGPAGDGIKIGVISDGMTHWSDANLSKDLPLLT